MTSYTSLLCIPGNVHVATDHGRHIFHALKNFSVFIEREDNIV